MSILVINDMKQLLEHLVFRCVWLFVFSFWCQKGAQISLYSLPFHRSEEESGGAELGGIHQTPDGEAKVSHCTCFQIFQASDVASNVISRRLNMQLQPVSVSFFFLPPESVPWLHYTFIILRISSENGGFDSGIISYSDSISAAYRTNPIKRPSASLKKQENWGAQKSARQSWAKSDWWIRWECQRINVAEKGRHFSFKANVVLLCSCLCLF